MLFKDIVEYAFIDIRENRLRSILAAICIILAAGAMVVTFSLKSSSVKYIESQFKILGSDSVAIQCLYNYTEKNQVLIDDNDVNDIKTLIPEINEMECMSFTSSYLRLKGNQIYCNIYGTNSTYIDISALEIIDGRYFDSMEEDLKQSVIVISDNLAFKLFSTTDCLGENLDVYSNNGNSHSYKIIGLYESTAIDSSITNSEAYPETVFLPLTTSSYLTGSDNIDIIQFWVKGDILRLREMSNQIVDFLELRHSVKNAYICTNSLDSQKQYTGILDLISSIGITLSGITLIVGCIGIMTIMLISVKERYIEIGILKAIGARKIDIIALFVLEILILSVLSGIVGIIFGLVTANGFSNYMGMTFTIDWTVVIAVFAGSIVLGFCFGVVPAYKASLLDIKSIFLSE